MNLPTTLSLALATTVATLAVACDVEAPPPGTPAELTKSEAASLGKADGFDYCAYFDWYGDGICDSFCLDPDPDCEEEELECPNVCEAVCAGEPEPELPIGCPTPLCQCEEAPECPDICEAVCAGEPEPELPNGCPTPQCQCEEAPECPDICEAVCSGEPEPELPNGCPTPQCQCN